jgi:hypothetical protein
MMIDRETSSIGSVPRRAPINVMSSAKEEEGSAKGEIWAVLRALGVLVGVIVLVGFVIA